MPAKLKPIDPQVAAEIRQLYKTLDAQFKASQVTTNQHHDFKLGEVLNTAHHHLTDDIVITALKKPVIDALAALVETTPAQAKAQLKAFLQW